jgi:D-alanine-D-alanine ligase
VVHNKAEFKKRLKFLFGEYKKDVIAEEYIKGREFNAAVLGGEPLPISEIDFTGLPDHLPGIVTYEGKWADQSLYYKHTNPVCPAKITSKLERSLKETAVKAYNALNCRDYARVDLRIDENNVPFVIEVNPNPDIFLDSGFVRAAKAAGMEYPDLLSRIADMALNRKIA